MRTSIYHKPVLLLTGFSLFLAACTNDVYEPKAGPTPNEEGISQELKDFGFATRGDVKLNVNYNASGFKALVEVFSEYPLQNDSNVKKEGVKPIYSAYTDDNGKFEGVMYVPLATDKVYLYTDRWGLPQCVELDAVAGGFSYDATKVTSTKAGLRSAHNIFINDVVPYDFGYLSKFKDGNDLLSLCQWDINGSIGKEDTGKDYLSITTVTDKGESIGGLTARVQSYFDATADRSTFLSEANVTNIVVKENDTQLDVIFLDERAAYHNTVGYYYYKAGKNPTRDELFAMRKFIIYPNVSNDEGLKVLPTGATARLQFFGENYNQAPTDNFPAGYVVGWFFISNGFSESSNIRQASKWALAATMNTIFFSNDVGNFRRFVSLDDKKSGLLVLGFEDQVVVSSAEDYSDVLFFVKSNKDISNGERPSVPDEEPSIPEKTTVVSGVLAFEDIWPKGGDYDMNDVALRYSRDITFDKDNNVTALEEHFKFVQKGDAATIDNYFAYQVQNIGEVVEKPADCMIESETGSFIITTSAKPSTGKEFTIRRTFNGSLNKDVVSKDFNPFIIVGELNNNRKEVHLPMMRATSKVDQSLVGTVDEAYYMNREGKYPFAIDIAKDDFELSGERISIDKTYPRFATWANNHGKTDMDWYIDAPKK